MHPILLQADYTVNILAELLKQGPVITCLGVAVWYFYKKSQEHEADLKAANDKHDADIARANDKLETYMKDDRELLLTALNNNTRVMEELKKYIDKD
jgi:hypothetical protein